MLDAKIKREIENLFYSENGTSFLLENEKTGEEIHITKLNDGVIDIAFNKETVKVYAMLNEIYAYIEEFTKKPIKKIKYKEPGKTIH